MWNLILNAAINYVASHPEVIEKLLNEAVQAGIHAIAAHNVATAAQLAATKQG